MPYTKIALFVGALIVIIGILVGVGYWSSTTTGTGATSTPITVTNGPGYTIEQVKLDQLEQPDLSRPVHFAASIPENVRPTIQAKVDKNVATLKADPSNPGAWLDLALWYKTADDYDGARLIWEFMTKAAPLDPTAFENLGKMYHFDTKDFPKSEMYFMEAKKIAPKALSPYLELFELYSLSYKKDTTAAADIMHQAEALFPQDARLPYTLGAMYRDQGKTAAARAEFEKALSLARAQNDLDLMAELNNSLVALPK